MHARHAALITLLTSAGHVDGARGPAYGASRGASCADGRLGARTSHALAYDAGGRHVVLFGGLSDDSTDAHPPSLWAWDGGRWRCIAADGPPGRADAFLAYDAARGRLVLFGGRVFLPARQVRYLRDTWEWDGARWTRAGG
jgi:hypothetical protein